MDNEDIDKIEQLNLSKLLPYVQWIAGVVAATENLWKLDVSKKPIDDPDALEKELKAIPFDAPVETQTALLMETERIGLQLAPAFLDKNLRLTPEKADMQIYIEMGALTKGTEKLLHKLHHFLHNNIQFPKSAKPAYYSNFTAMRGMMLRDYGSLKNLLWSMGKHDMKISALERLIDFFEEADPPPSVMAFVLKTHSLIKGDFFQWVENLNTTFTINLPKS